MLSVIPHRRRASTPFSAVAHALPGLPSLPGMPAREHGHERMIVVASATAGLVVGTAAGAVIFSGRGHHDHGDAEPAEEQVAAGAKEA